MKGEDYKDIGRILRYGINEAPEELELMIQKGIATEKLFQMKSQLGLSSGKLSLIIAAIGIVIGIGLGIDLYFKDLPLLLEVRGVIDTIVDDYLFNPLILAVTISVSLLLLLDSIFERWRLGRLS